MRKETGFFISSLLIIALIASCTPMPAQIRAGEINITVSILPQKFFVERIGGDRVNVNVMVGPGDSPHTYEPKPEQMRAISFAEIYFAIGVEFEDAWVDRIASANTEMTIIDLSENIDKIPVAGHGHDDESENETDEDHENEGLDPHIWTSPEIAKTISRRIADELAQIDPNNKQYYQANLNQLIDEIEQLQEDIRTELENIENRKFLVFHPAWGYFAQEFNLVEIAIELGGTEPSASELSEIIDTARNEKIRVVFAQPEFSTQIADYIASEINGSVVLITPLAENWMDNLRTVAQSFSENL